MGVHMKFRSYILMTAVMVIVTGCGQPVQVSADEAEAYAKAVDDVTENSLIGLSDNDFEKHTRDFDSSMLDVVDAASFPQAYADIIGIIGKYESKELSAVFDQSEFRIIVYKAKFENERDVTVRFVFRRDDPNRKISGMWFDSELLRAAGNTK